MPAPKLYQGVLLQLQYWLAPSASLVQNNIRKRRYGTRKGRFSMRPMSIVEVIPSLAMGGAEHLVVSLSEELLHSGSMVHILALGFPDGTALEQQTERDHLQVTWLGKNLGPSLQTVCRAFTVVASMRPDVVHTHLGALKYVLPGCWGAHVGVRVHTVHTLADRELTGMDLRLQQWAYLRAGVVPVAVDRAVLLSMHRVYGDACPVRLIENGVAVSRERMDAPHRIDHIAPKFVCVARFSEPKRQDAIVRAFQVLVRTYPGAELHFVGDGPGLEATRLLAQQLNIDRRIVFHGWLDDPHDTVSACDIFVLASEYEGFSLSAVEAMASGLPVILGLGQAESLSLLSIARIVSLDDQAIAQAMLDVATDDDLAADLRVRGFAFARAHSIEETGRSYITLFQQILEREGHEPR